MARGKRQRMATPLAQVDQRISQGLADIFRQRRATRAPAPLSRGALPAMPPRDRRIAIPGLSAAQLPRRQLGGLRRAPLFARVPGLQRGLYRVPAPGLTARLHGGEMVVPRPQAQLLRRTPMGQGLPRVPPRALGARGRGSSLMTPALRQQLAMRLAQRRAMGWA